MNRERLVNGLKIMGIPVDDDAVLRFERFHALLDEANAHMDLTAVLEEDERIDRHDLDSVTVLSKIPIPKGASVIDVGTGAGFPGIPILILRPDLKMVFMDAQQKRIAFLQSALEELGLSAEVVHSRAEDAGQGTLRERFDFAVSRAVAPMPVLEEYMLPLIKVGGLGIAWKGPKAQEEMDAARRAAFLLGGKIESVLEAPVPLREEWNHILIATRKSGKTPKGYPRKAGTPAKKPLG